MNHDNPYPRPTKQGVAQLVESRIWSAVVGGSSPLALTNFQQR